ncbi:MAG TPA: diacylglycerol kinase family protein [Gemmatimonadaceae bacterium]|jgi:diacylglycerol kinase family enzyme|nr:diacylglycerol kinase family protein [Gemmatimonadaceae bacterium]
MPTPQIHAFVNLSSGSGEAAREALEGVGVFDVAPCHPEHLDRQIEQAVREGAERVVVAGGDGTIAKAAAALVGKKTALAVVPGGTLNHFAKDHGIPRDPVEAAELSATGATTTTDVGTVNGRVFLNTTSVGAYVVFVRTRERLERRFGYRLATVIAAVRLLGRIRAFTVEMELDGQPQRYQSALVFVGVGERELQLPSVGGLAQNGRRGLHVIVVRGGTWARLVAAGLVAAFRGNDAVKRERLADSYVVDACRIVLRRRRGRVAVDGEIVEMSSPLDYRIEYDALRLVVPPDAAQDE